MATIPHSRSGTGSTAVFVATWPSLAQGDDGDALPFAQYSDKSVQVAGTFGGATLRVEGSNNGGSTWATLTDPQGNDLLITSAKIEMVTEATVLVRPIVVGGDGTTSLTVSMLCKEVR
jgi:hypothetical protein